MPTCSSDSPPMCQVYCRLGLWGFVMLRICILRNGLSQGLLQGLKDEPIDQRLKQESPLELRAPSPSCKRFIVAHTPDAMKPIHIDVQTNPLFPQTSRQLESRIGRASDRIHSGDQMFGDIHPIGVTALRGQWFQLPNWRLSTGESSSNVISPISSSMSSTSRFILFD